MGSHQELLHCHHYVCTNQAFVSSVFNRCSEQSQIFRSITLNRVFGRSFSRRRHSCSNAASTPKHSKHKRGVNQQGPAQEKPIRDNQYNTAFSSPSLPDASTLTRPIAEQWGHPHRNASNVGTAPINNAQARAHELSNAASHNQRCIPNLETVATTHATSPPNVLW